MIPSDILADHPIEADPRLIPGIYNYCDRCCHRCAFTTRCLTFRESQHDEAALHAGTKSLTEIVHSSFQRAIDALREAATEHGIDLSMTAEEKAQAIREEEQHRAELHQDPLVAAAERYARTTMPIVRALMPVVVMRGDAPSVEAVTRIEELCLLVASKTYRAVSSASDGDEAHLRQSDMNGSAKLARLLVRESLEAWQVLMEAGRATADGVPARLVGQLEQLDAALHERFPNAMAFVRPGFDTERA